MLENGLRVETQSQPARCHMSKGGCTPTGWPCDQQELSVPGGSSATVDHLIYVSPWSSGPYGPYYDTKGVILQSEKPQAAMSLAHETQFLVHQPSVQAPLSVASGFAASSTLNLQCTRPVDAAATTTTTTTTPSSGTKSGAATKLGISQHL